MKWILTLVALGLVVAGAIYSGLTAATTVDAARAQQTEIREFVDEQAQTRLPLTHLITMPFDGRVEAIDLAEGAPVKKDQVVAQVVPLDLQLTVADAEANIQRLEAAIRESGDKTVELTGLKQAVEYVNSMLSTVEAAAARVESGKAKLDFANKDLSRVRSLHERSSASVEQLQAAELRQVEAAVEYRQDELIYKSLQSVLAATQLLPTVVRQYTDRKDLSVAVLDNEKNQAQVKLEQQKRDRDRGTMKSPIDGVVLERLETNERRVSPGTVLLKIGNPNELEVEADVLSQDVVRVKLGDAVEIYGPAVGAQGAKGNVSRIYPAGFTKVSSLGVEQQRVKVIVRFSEDELQRLRKENDLGVGYRVRVRIITAEKPQALTVPRSALFRGPDGRWQLFAIRDGRAKLTDVTVGLLNDERVEITGGLTAEEQVVLAPESSLVDGLRVRPAAE
jgi:HlyD family secretion protein